MNLLALSAFADNYIWMLHDGVRAFVVDPGDAAPVVAALDRLDLQLAGILVTHHHADRVGGVEALRPRLQGPVNGPARERIPAPFMPLKECDTVEMLGLHFEVLDVPGHTAGHIAYVQRDAGREPLLFCGDTLCSGGYGRLFEGTPAQMHDSLSKLAALPTDARVCCTHEYMLSNLRFAAAAEPASDALMQYRARCEALRVQGQPTLPSNIGQERSINPFPRCAQPAVVRAARAQGAADDSPVAVLAAWRERKNRC